jgi:hypothetical protein
LYRSGPMQVNPKVHLEAHEGTASRVTLVPQPGHVRRASSLKNSTLVPHSGHRTSTAVISRMSDPGHFAISRHHPSESVRTQ